MMTLRARWLAFTMTIALGLAAGVPVGAAEHGVVTAILAGRMDVASVTLICRADGTRVRGTVDAATRRATVAGVPFGKDFDCIIEYAGARLEGVNLTVPRSDYVEEQPLAPADAALVKDKARAMNAFENIVEVLAVEGNIQHAAVLLHKLRTTPFVNSAPGQVIWRVELWRYERPEDHWVRAQEDFGVLHRERIPRAEFDKHAITFDRALGGLRLTADRPALDLGEISPPSTEPGIRYRDGRKQ